MTLTNVLGIYVALQLMDTTRRRTLLKISTAGMFASCIFVVLALLGFIHGGLSVLALISFVFFYDLGLGPIPSLIVSELFDPRNVATASMSMFPFLINKMILTFFTLKWPLHAL